MKTIILLIGLSIPSWEALPNRMVLINGVSYHAIREINYCERMHFKKYDEIILKAGKVCYRIDRMGFRVDLLEH